MLSPDFKMWQEDRKQLDGRCPPALVREVSEEPAEGGRRQQASCKIEPDKAGLGAKVSMLRGSRVVGTVAVL